MCNLVLYLTESAVAECRLINVMGTRYLLHFLRGQAL